ncbi:hypothetical protein HY009_09830 [Candidatus Acetothermia bacterium]|nr:hypothetical protein [Candidatus Acetothermia bacterium]
MHARVFAGAIFIGLLVLCFGQAQASHDQTNQHPVAKIVGPTIIQVGNIVVLDASQSYDPDPNDRYLEFHWSLVSKPEGSRATLSRTNGPVISATTDVVGNYIFGLTVQDPHGNSTYTLTSVSAIGPPIFIDVTQIARILDTNYNRRLDDEEMLQAMRVWILAIPLGTSDTWLGDLEMTKLLQMWADETLIP